ncbi:MAG TPA: adenylyl-sulfate kinase [Candidatus Binatia bacterium]|nr:adenylyl-sulfate kinase [Candidatus Binatia bacterium]
MSWAVWITGLPGSGKSTIARAAAAELAARGRRPVVLELDALRRLLTPEPKYSAAEREVVYRSLVAMAAALVDAGLPVIIDATGHRRAWRDLARARLANFAEVQLRCPLSLSQARERARPAGHAPPGIYARAGRPGATVPGVDVAYEEASCPELVVDTAVEDPSAAAARIARLVEAWPRAAAPAAAGAGWVIWITGLPGSGKTTLADRAVEELTLRGLPARRLSWADFRGVMPPGPPLEWEDEILHRALVVTAMLLADAGVRVIVDATAPRRRWRELARRLVRRFAEVQLRCPRAICAERELRGRWSAPGAAAPAAPDIVPTYEEALVPELALDTDLRDVQGCVQEIVRLACRLERSGGEVSPV